MLEITSLLILICVVNSSLSAEILCIFPKPSYSHQAVYRAVTEKLLERGHKLTVLTTHPSDNERSHENVTLIDVSFSVEMHQKFLEEIPKMKSLLNVLKYIDLDAGIVDQQLSSEGMQNLLNDDTRKFDLLLLETLGGPGPYHALAEKFNMPVVGIASADAMMAGHQIMGNEINAVTQPERVMPFIVAESFSERVKSCIFSFLMRFVFIPRSERNFDALIQKYFPEIRKTTHDLVQNVDLLLINVHPALGYIRPILPNTIPLGFLHIKPPKPLPKELSALMENSKHGVIYMSFGTVVSAIFFEENFESFLKAFSELPYDVLWKYDGEVPKNVAPNVHIRKWFPQSDLLAHPEVKLFITHGGQHSIEESIMRHVPMLVCPFHGDQTANAKRVSNRKIAKSLNIHEILRIDQIKNLVNEIINDPSYKENIVKLAKLVEDIPMSSADKAVWHIEYVIRNKGARHLTYPQKKISFFQYHYYDIVISVFGTLLLVVWLIYIMIKLSLCLFKRLMPSKQKKS